MKATIKFVVALLPFAMAIPIIANAQENFPRTALGKPDFNGNYDISSLTPYQRPTRYGNRLVLTEEEVQAMREREMTARERGSEQSDPDRSAPEEGGNIGSYNDFWFDRGDDGFTIDGQSRTSILT